MNRGGLGEQVEGGDGFVSVGFCFDDISQVAEQGLKVYSASITGVVSNSSRLLLHSSTGVSAWPALVIGHVAVGCWILPDVLCLAAHLRASILLTNG